MKTNSEHVVVSSLTLGLSLTECPPELCGMQTLVVVLLNFRVGVWQTVLTNVECQIAPPGEWQKSILCRLKIRVMPTPAESNHILPHPTEPWRIICTDFSMLNHTLPHCTTALQRTLSHLFQK